MALAGGSAGGAGGASGGGDGSVETGLAKELLSRLQTPVWLYNVDEQRVVYANATASRLVHREDTGGGVHIIDDWPTRIGRPGPWRHQLTLRPAVATPGAQPQLVDCTCSVWDARSSAAPRMVLIEAAHPPRLSRRPSLAPTSSSGSSSSASLLVPPPTAVPAGLRLLAQATQNVDICLAVYDAEGRVAAQNAASEAAFGIGHRLLDRFAATPATAGLTVKALLATGYIGDLRVPTLLAGAPVWYWMHVRPWTESNNTGGATTAAEEVPHLLCISIPLDAIDAVRFLQVAKIQADEASKAKSRFLATVSHELRTPLHGLLGFADLLRETSPMSSEQLAYVEMLRSTGRALMSIVNDILELSRIEAGTVVFAPVPFYIGDCVREVLDVVYGQACERRLRLCWDIDLGDGGGTTGGDYLGDVKLLKQVLVNLLGNAIKFTRANGSVRIVVRRVDDGNGGGNGGSANVDVRKRSGSSSGSLQPQDENEGSRAVAMFTGMDDDESLPPIHAASSTESGQSEEEDVPGVVPRAPALARRQSSRSSASGAGSGGSGHALDAWRTMRHRIQFSVEDTGIGIPSTVSLDDLCRPFVQVPKDLRGDSEGTGLGLTICKQFVDIMGGHMTMSSQLGKGSTFTITVPLRPHPLQLPRVHTPLPPIGQRDPPLTRESSSLSSFEGRLMDRPYSSTSSRSAPDKWAEAPVPSGGGAAAVDGPSNPDMMLEVLTAMASVAPSGPLLRNRTAPEQGPLLSTSLDTAVAGGAAGALGRQVSSPYFPYDGRGGDSTAAGVTGAVAAVAPRSPRSQADPALASSRSLNGSTDSSMGSDHTASPAEPFNGGNECTALPFDLEAPADDVDDDFSLVAFPSSSIDALNYLRSSDLAPGSSSAVSSSASSVAYPRTPRADADWPRSTTPGPVGGGGGGEGPRARVLAAEDNIVNQVLLQRMLQQMNCDLVIASNGQEAVDLLVEQGPRAFDLILMDVSMPVMDGLEATRAIRRLFPNRDDAPIIVGMTANAMKSQEDQCMEAGMDSFLPKPTPLDLIRSTIVRYAGRHLRPPGAGGETEAPTTESSLQGAA